MRSVTLTTPSGRLLRLVFFIFSVLLISYVYFFIFGFLKYHMKLM